MNEVVVIVTIPGSHALVLAIFVGQFVAQRVKDHCYVQNQQKERNKFQLLAKERHKKTVI